MLTVPLDRFSLPIRIQGSFPAIPQDLFDTDVDGRAGSFQRRLSLLYNEDKEPLAMPLLHKIDGSLETY